MTRLPFPVMVVEEWPGQRKQESEEAERAEQSVVLSAQLGI
jgi:hypothetical protein